MRSLCDRKLLANDSLCEDWANMIPAADIPCDTSVAVKIIIESIRQLMAMRDFGGALSSRGPTTRYNSGVFDTRGVQVLEDACKAGNCGEKGSSTTPGNTRLR